MTIIKRVEIHVQDEAGQPVSNAHITLRNVAGAAAKMTRRHRRDAADTYAVWENLLLDGDRLFVHCLPPAGYAVVDAETVEMAADARQMTFVVGPAPEPEQPDIYQEAERLDEEPVVDEGDFSSDEIETQAAVPVPEELAAFYGDDAAQDEAAKYREETMRQEEVEDERVYQEFTSRTKLGYEQNPYEWDLGWCVKKFVDGLVVDMRSISGEDECDLCADFDGLKSAVDDTSIEGCDAETAAFIGGELSQRLIQLHGTCLETFAELDDIISFASVGERGRTAGRDWLCRVLPEALQARFGDWVDGLSDLMTDYKGVYDLVLLEAATQQLPGQFLDNIRLELDAPFATYQYQQKQIGTVLSKLEKGPVGVCLDELVWQCREAVGAVSTLREDLDRAKYGAMPAAVEAFGAGVALLERGMIAACGAVSQVVIGYSAGQGAAEMQAAQAAIKAQRDQALSLINELREAVRLQQLPQSWRDRARWLSAAKKGLTDVWEDLNQLVFQLRQCIDLIESGTDELWLQYSAGSAPDQVAAALLGGPDAQAKVVGQLVTALNQTLTEFRQSSSVLSSAVQDMATFSPTKGDSGGGSGGGTDGSMARRRVDSAIAAVVGRPLGSDPNAFRAVLNGTFPEDQESGQIARQPVRTVVSLAGDRGQLAASQGTLSHEVQLIVNDALRVLKGLRAIGPDTDNERAEALTEMVRLEFEALIPEASRVDRPRQSRIEEIFGQLAAPDAHLDQLRRELGLNSLGDLLTNPNLVTQEEAQLMASIDLLDGYAETLTNTFDRYFATPAGRDPRDGSFSGRLAFVSLQFSVVANQVREVEAAMDAVDFSQPERRTTFITDPLTDTLISVDGILSWISNVAVAEGADLIARGGRIGLKRVLEIINGRLQPLLDELLAISQGLRPAPHPGLKHSRVRNGLQQLAIQLQQFNPSKG